MTITPKEVSQSILESTIYWSTQSPTEQEAKTLLRDYQRYLKTTLETLRALPSKNTESITHICEIQSMMVYDYELLNTSLCDHINLIKLHKIN